MRAKAWAWANQPTTRNYIPDPSFQYNSADQTNQIGRLDIGQYQVDLPGLSTSGGIAHAVAYGGNHYCKVVLWQSSGENQLVRVNCFTPDGRPIDGRFVLLFYKETGGETRANAYLWADQPSATSYTPNAAYQWNSKGGINTVQRIKMGHYLLVLPEINVSGGTVLATAYGPGTEHCKVGGWSQSGNNLLINVHCFDLTGNPVDTRFTLSFMANVGLGARSPEDQHYGGYIWADQPTSASYTPNRTYQLNTTGGINTITRSSIGTYTVNLPGLASINSATALTTAYGSGSEYCTIGKWTNDGNGGTNVHVQCFNHDGSLTDTRFTLVYLTDDETIF